MSPRNLLPPCAVLFLIFVIGIAGGCSSSPAPENGAAKGLAASDFEGFFRDVTSGSGLDFTYRNGEEADHYTILESLGGGVALLDYDGDGRLDIFLCGGGYFDGQQIRGRPCKLFKNLGDWKFQDVTAEALVPDSPWFYSHGCAVADYDNDGWPDLLVTGWGRLALFHNEPDPKGGRRLVEVTRGAALEDVRWATGAAWGDLDGDGYPDLYVCQYLDWSFANHPFCGGYAGDAQRDVCPPKKFQAVPHRLYRNKRDGTFQDVSKEAGLRSDGKGLGVLMVDVNGDSRPDIYVANDTTDNFLYINRSKPGQIRLEEVGLPTGVARDDTGVPDGSMGVDAADYNGSGQASLWVTNYENELHGLYRNRGDGFFLYATRASGAAAVGNSYVGFGTAFLDVDGDGWEDLVISNGHVIRHASNLKQKPVLLHNRGDGRFVNASARGGGYFRAEHRGRGLAVGDLDNDGRPDLVISHQNEPVVLLRNQVSTAGHWLGVEVVDAENRDMVGAKLILEAAGYRQTRFIKGGGSYFSAGDRRILFGLGDRLAVRKLTIISPDGRSHQWDGSRLAVDRYQRLVVGRRDDRGMR